MKIKESLKKIWTENPKIKKTIGVIFVIIGFLSIITPFTPLGFLFLIGLEVLGIRMLVWDKLKNWFRK
ncbi:MAG: hypothetical protein U1C12_00870 [Patescibacteria group bacterium]|nr:hypothetical protein [Patescibacteria group bacterium]